MLNSHFAQFPSSRQFVDLPVSGLSHRCHVVRSVDRLGKVAVPAIRVGSISSVDYCFSPCLASIAVSGFSLKTPSTPKS